MKDKYNIKELEEKINRCKKMKFEDINPDDVDELSSIKIDRKKPSNERILDFLMQVKNPYVFKVNGRLVKLEFTDNGKKAVDAIINVIKSIYR